MLKNENSAIGPRTKRLKVYIPALYEAPHEERAAFFGFSGAEAKVSYPIDLKLAEKYFDVVTDKVEGKNIKRLTKAQLKGVDLFLIPAKDPGNTSSQDGRNDEGAFVPVTRQYLPYTADGPHVRKVSIAGDTLPDGTRQNRSYYGQKALTTNPEQLDQILTLAGKAKKMGIPSVVAMFAGKPLCFHEFEPAVDGILLAFAGMGVSVSACEAILSIAAGQCEPCGLLPMQMPKDMDDIERQAEDTPRDMECYTDSVGHKYDFAYGMNYAGVIKDDRVKKYAVPPYLRPENRGVIEA